jgi:metal transporter CNNM
MTLNKVSYVPNNESLLGVLDKFQDGRMHMVIVSRFSVERAKSVKKAVKQSLTQRIRQTVGISDNSGSSSESEDSENENETGSTGTGAHKPKHRKNTTSDGSVDRNATPRGNPTSEDGSGGDYGGSEASESDVAKRQFRLRRKKGGKRRRKTRLGKRVKQEDVEMGEVSQPKYKIGSVEFGLSSKEQITPADAVLAEESANEVRVVLSRSHFRLTLTWCV